MASDDFLQSLLRLLISRHLIDLSPTICDGLQFAKVAELLRIELAKVKQVEFLSTKNIAHVAGLMVTLTLPRSRSHIRPEIGKSMSLSSTMLLAKNVPAMRKSCMTSVTSSSYIDF